MIWSLYLGLITDSESEEISTKISKMFGLQYWNLKNLISEEKSNAKNQFSRQEIISISQITNLIQRKLSETKCDINGFCLNVDFLTKKEDISKFVYFLKNNTIVSSKICLK